MAHHLVRSTNSCSDILRISYSLLSSSQKGLFVKGKKLKITLSSLLYFFNYKKVDFPEAGRLLNNSTHFYEVNCMEVFIVVGRWAAEKLCIVTSGQPASQHNCPCCYISVSQEIGQQSSLCLVYKPSTPLGTAF